MIDRKKDTALELAYSLVQGEVKGISKFNKLMRKLYKGNGILSFGKLNYERAFVFSAADHVHGIDLSSYLEGVADYDRNYHAFLENPEDSKLIGKKPKYLVYLNLAHADLGVIEPEQMKNFNLRTLQVFPKFLNHLIEIERRYVAYKIVEGIIDKRITKPWEKEMEKRNLSDFMVIPVPSDKEIVNSIIKTQRLPIDEGMIERVFPSFKRE